MASATAPDVRTPLHIAADHAAAHLEADADARRRRAAWTRTSSTSAWVARTRRARAPSSGR